MHFLDLLLPKLAAHVPSQSAGGRKPSEFEWGGSGRLRRRLGRVRGGRRLGFENGGLGLGFEKGGLGVENGGMGLGFENGG